MNSNRSGRRYDREFKNNAVALVRGGRTITEVARDLGVSKWSLGHWVRQAEEGQLLSEPKTLTLETPEQRELRRLRQELEYVPWTKARRETSKLSCSSKSFERQGWIPGTSSGEGVARRGAEPR